MTKPLTTEQPEICHIDYCMNCHAGTNVKHHCECGKYKNPYHGHYIFDTDDGTDIVGDFELR